MKGLLSCCAALLLFLVSAPAQALEPLVLYDDFNQKFIDPDKWVGFDNTDGCCPMREAVREIQNKRLRLAYRIHGDQGGRFGQNRLIFEPSNPVTAIEATVQVRQFQVKGCAGTPLFSGH